MICYLLTLDAACFFFFFFLMIRRPPRSTLFPYRRSSDLPAPPALREPQKWLWGQDSPGHPDPGGTAAPSPPPTQCEHLPPVLQKAAPLATTTPRVPQALQP